MNIRFNRKFGAVLLGLGFLFLLVRTLLIAYWTGSFQASFTVAPDLVFLILPMMGIFMLTRTYLVVDDEKIIIKSLLGPLNFKYVLQSRKDLLVEKDQVFIERCGQRQKLKIHKNQADRRDWTQFLIWLKSSG